MERMPRLKKGVERLAAAGGTQYYGPKASRTKIVQMAAEDDKYWDREIRRPAISFLARRARALPAIPADAAAALASVVGKPDHGHRRRDSDPFADDKRGPKEKRKDHGDGCRGGGSGSSLPLGAS